MKPSRAASLLLVLLAVLSTPPLAAHGIFVAEPRNVSGGTLEYRIVVLATNEGLKNRRFSVARITAQPFGSPSSEPLGGAYVAPGTVLPFVIQAGDEISGLLRVDGAPQILAGARLEVFEQGRRIDTVTLPAIPAHADEGHADRRASLPHEEPPPGQDFHHVLYLPGLAATPEGSVISDLSIVSLGDEGVDCVVEVSLAGGTNALVVPHLHVPAGAAVSLIDLFASFGDPTLLDAGIEDARALVSCEQETFYAWAAVYRDGGRDVHFVSPAVPNR